MRTTQHQVHYAPNSSTNSDTQRLTKFNRVKQFVVVAGLAAILACSTASGSAIHSKATYLNVADKAVRLLDSPLTTRQRQLRNAENFNRLPASDQQVYALAVTYYSMFQSGSPGRRLTAVGLAQDIATVDVYCGAYAGTLDGTFPSFLSGVQTLSGGFGSFLPWNKIIQDLPVDPEQLERIDLADLFELAVSIRPVNNAQMIKTIGALMAQIEVFQENLDAMIDSMKTDFLAGAILAWIWDVCKSGDRDDDGDGIRNGSDDDQDGDGLYDSEYGGTDEDNDNDGVPNDDDDYPDDKDDSCFPWPGGDWDYIFASWINAASTTDLALVPVVQSGLPGFYFIPKYLK